MAKHKRPIVDKETFKAWFGWDDRYAKRVIHRRIRRTFKAEIRKAMTSGDYDREQRCC